MNQDIPRTTEQLQDQEKLDKQARKTRRVLFDLSADDYSQGEVIENASDWVITPPNKVRCGFCANEFGVAFGISPLIECSECLSDGCPDCIRLHFKIGEYPNGYLLCPECRRSNSK